MFKLERIFSIYNIVYTFHISLCKFLLIQYVEPPPTIAALLLKSELWTRKDLQNAHETVL